MSTETTTGARTGAVYGPPPPLRRSSRYADAHGVERLRRRAQYGLAAGDRRIRCPVCEHVFTPDVTITAGSGHVKCRYRVPPGDRGMCATWLLIIASSDGRPTWLAEVTRDELHWMAQQRMSPEQEEAYLGLERPRPPNTGD